MKRKKFNLAILTRPPHKPPPSILDPPQKKKIGFFDVSDDLKQKKFPPL